MTFERDLFISFSAGISSGIIILLFDYIVQLKDISMLGKIIIGVIYFFIISLSYAILMILLKKFYNKYISFRIN